MNRQNSNRQLVQTLAALVEANPTQRFGQILRNYGFIRDQVMATRAGSAHEEHLWENEFNTESDNILERVLEECQKMEDSE